MPDATSTIQFINSTTDLEVVTFWLVSGHEQQYSTLSPGQAIAQRTYEGHAWRCRCASTNKLLGEVVAGSEDLVCEVLNTQPPSCSVHPLSLPDFKPKPEWGSWRQRGEAPPGIPVLAYDCVGDPAVQRACYVIWRMLENVPKDVQRLLVQRGTRVGIIGCNQVTTDIPEHCYLKLCKGGRDLDATTRGLGGTVSCPMTTCGEENLTMSDGDRYPEESILVHEFGHAVMNIGLDEATHSVILQEYLEAKAKGTYRNPDCYAMSNADEYWAEGTQAWFEATVRTDVNGGINSRQKLWQHDAGLASVFLKVFGDNPWKYTDDCPQPFRKPTKPKQAAHLPHPTTPTSNPTDSTHKPGLPHSSAEAHTRVSPPHLSMSAFDSASQQLQSTPNGLLHDSHPQQPSADSAVSLLLSQEAGHATPVWHASKGMSHGAEMGVPESQALKPPDLPSEMVMDRSRLAATSYSSAGNAFTQCASTSFIRPCGQALSWMELPLSLCWGRPCVPSTSSYSPLVGKGWL